MEVQTKDSAPVPAFRLVIESEGPAHAPGVVRLTAKDEDSGAADADDVVFQAVATLPKTDALVGRAGVAFVTLLEALKRSEKTLRRSLKRLRDSGRIVVTGQATKQAALYGVNNS